jgi:hypothetical protein
MVSGKNLSAWVVGWILGALASGCAGAEQNLFQDPSAAPPPAPRPVREPQPGPELRIPPSPPPPPAVVPAVAPSSLDAGANIVPLELDTVAKLRTLQRLAAARYASIDSYIVRLRRREQVNGKDKPEEILLFKFRKEPWSVSFKWLSAEGKGREVIYVHGQYHDKIQTLLAAGDIPLMPAGRRIALAPDNPLVRSSSRHVITEAGFGALLEQFDEAVTALEHGDTRRGTFKCLGTVKRPEFELPGQAVEQIIPPESEPTLPRGGRRLLFFDPQHALPVLVVTHDETGHEVEYYCYDRLQYPVRLDDDDFNTDKLWGSEGGKRRAQNASRAALNGICHNDSNRRRLWQPEAISAGSVAAHLIFLQTNV